MPKRSKAYTEQSRSGFTLIELLVVISIIAILSAVGLVAYNGIRGKAQDAKIKADLNAIKKAYESNYDPTTNGGQGGYKRLSTDGVTSSYFADGKIPKQPNGSPYPCAVGPDNSCLKIDSGGYKVSAALADGSITSVTSTQGTTPASELNLCDPLNTLSTGLIGYWPMNELSGTTVEDKKSGNNGSLSGSVSRVDAVDNAAFKKALSFNGGSVNISSQPSVSNFSLSMWVNFSDTNFNNSQSLFSNNQFFLRKDVLAEGNKISGFIHLNDNSYEPRARSIVPVSGTWYNVIQTWEGTTQKMYINGEIKASSTRSGSFASYTQTQIGTGTIAGPFYGMVDDIRLYNEVLDDARIILISGSGNRADACI